MKKTLVLLICYMVLATSAAWGQDAMYFYNLGLESSMFNRKIDYFTRALELNYFQGKYAKMMVDFQKFTDLEPSKPEGFRMLGLAYMKMGNLDTAIHKFSRAIELDPKLTSAYSQRGEAYLQKGMTAEAIRDATRAIELGGAQPIIGRAYTVRSKAYRKLGQYGLADADFDKAYELDPENYFYKYFTITNHLASFTNDSSYINSADIRRLGLVGIIALLFVLIFRVALPSPRKDDTGLE
jgi:tetratricopeptide (TPR) repeat protein